MSPQTIERREFSKTTLIMGVVNVIIGAAVLFLGLRFLLKLFAASTSAPFVAWIYSTSAPLLQPFQGMFPNSVLEGGIVFEFTSLFAILIYEIVRYLLLELIAWIDLAKTR